VSAEYDSRTRTRPGSEPPMAKTRATYIRRAYTLRNNSMTISSSWVPSRMT
jgi:hypothetical protein